MLKSPVSGMRKPHFFQDMADGFKYMWEQKGLRIILIIAALINFFSYIAITLFLPLCRFDPALAQAGMES